MNEILTDLSDIALAGAVQANLQAMFRSFGSSDQAEVGGDDRFFRWHTQIAHPWFNGALSLRAPDETAAQFAGQLIAYFRSRQVDSFSWWCTAEIAISAWRPVLESLGYFYVHETPGMAVDLAGLSMTARQPESFEIHDVDTLAALQEWTRVFIEGYGLSGEFVQPYYKLVASLGLSLPFRYYLGFLGGKAVAASTLFLGAGVAGIYNVATIQEARGRGLGGALTVYPLLQARQMGYQAGILQSSEMGYPVYQRLGFRKVCDVEHFIWSTKENI
jgi:GNAT superfamily N-acetyltransferase